MGWKEFFRDTVYKIQGLPLIFILVLSLFCIVLPDATYSIKEKRYLAIRPDLTLNNLADGSFFESYENYFSDQFPFRRVWLSIKESLELQ